MTAQPRIATAADDANAQFALVGLDKDLLDSLGVRIVAIFDLKSRGAAYGIPVIGSDDAWPAYKAAHPAVRPLMAIDPPLLRRKLTAHYGRDDVVSFVAPSAEVSHHVVFGKGVVIQRRVYVSADVRLAEGVRINVGTQIHHDCELGSFTTVAPGALLMGSVKVGADVYIGAGAVILQGLTIADGATIGAGAVVTRAVNANETVAGCPAKPLFGAK